MSNQSFTFKRITAEDIPLLYGWFKQPHVSAWWPVPDGDEFFQHFLKRIRSDNTFAFLCILNNQPLGYIQYYYIDRTQPKAGSWLPPELPETTVGTDQFIGEPEFIGKGYGTRMIKDFITHFAQELEPEMTTIIVDPDPTNTAAIRCYQKVGFTVMGEYAAPWGQALLMRYEITQ